MSHFKRVSWNLAWSSWHVPTIQNSMFIYPSAF